MKKNRLGGLIAAQKKRRLDENADALPVRSVEHDIPLSAAELAAPQTDATALERDRRSNFRYFEQYALQLYDMGWMPLPQTRLGGVRKPGTVDGRTLQWGKYVDVRPDRDTVKYWARDPQAGHCNVAVILGEPSDNTFGIDADVMSKRENDIVQQCAMEHLGDTMIRYGREPKAMLIYRMDNAEDLPAYGKFVLADDAGQPNGDMVEILAHGRMVTMLGLHHGTGEPFRYDNGQPQLHSPRARATTVTPAQLAAFFEALVQRLKLYVPERAKYEDVTLAGLDADGIRIPHKSAWSGNEWIEQDGLVVDGREAFMWSTAKGFAKMNPGATPEQLVPLVIDAFRNAEHPQRRWMASRVKEAAEEKVFRALRMIKDGKMGIANRPKARDLVIDSKTLATAANDVIEDIPYSSPAPRCAAGPTTFLSGRRRESIKVKFTPADANLALTRALQTDRAAVGRETSRQTIAGVDAFLDDVIAMVPAVHVIAGATGAGKSTMALKRVAERHAEVFAQADENDERTGIIYLVPTYNNVDDLRAKAEMLKLDGGATDDELLSAAAEQGIVAPGDLDDHLKQLRRFAVASELTHMTYKGKVAAGCLRAPEMRLLQGANVSTSAMCKTKVQPRDSQGRKIEGEDGKPVDVFCQFYKSCPAIAQRHQLKEVDLIFMVRNFLTLSLPEEAKAARGVIIDERFFDLLIHERSFPMSTLQIARREPRLGKKEREAGMTARDLLQDRDEAAEHAIEVLRQRGDLAEHFYNLKVKRDGGKTVRGIELIGNARRVCGNAMTSQADLNPELTFEDIQELCAAPIGSHIADEFRFWKILEEQVQDLTEAYLDSTKTPPLDRRIRVVGELSREVGEEEKTVVDLDPDIQIAWRTEPNWAGVPTLLLDASTDPVLTSLALGGRDVITHEVEVSLNQIGILAVDRRLSARSLFPGKEASPEKKLEAAQLLADLRCTVSMTAATHAHGRVLYVATMKLRRALLKDWCPPGNADFAHYGAIAGLDFARRHVAIVFLSRMELPVRNVDGLVAALSHGQANPEPLIDPLGTGLNDEGEDLGYNIERHAHPLRDGGSAIWDLDAYQGDLARRVQKQYREEQHNQSVGRMRTVYREDPAIVIGVSSTPPRDLIADEIIGFKDLLHGQSLWDATRLTGGVIEPSILARYAPHLGEVDQYEWMIQEYLLKNPLVLSRYHKVTAVLEDGTERTIHVPGHVLDWKAPLIALLRDMGWKGRLKDIVRCAVSTPAADEAPVDKMARVLTAMGTKDAEYANLQRLMEALQARGEWRPTKGMMGMKGAPGIYRAGTGAYEKKALTLGGWMALEVLEDEWVRDGMLTQEQVEKLGIDEDVVKVRRAASTGRTAPQ